MNWSPHVIVIGGGLTGLNSAVTLGAEGLRVLMLRLPDDAVPNAESLRGYSRLHFGLHDPATSRTEAVKLQVWGQRMLEYAGLRRPSMLGFSGDPALYAVGPDMAPAFEADARRLAFSSSPVRRLSRREAEARMGPVYDPGLWYYAVPEELFDAAEVMRYLRQQADGLGVHMLECTEPAALVRSRDCLLRVQAGNREFTAPAIVLAAGAGTDRLLNQAGVAHALGTTLSPLLVLPGTHGISTPILVDRTTGLTIARHLPSENVPGGCLVIGREPEPGAPGPAPERRVQAAERDAILALLPPGLGAAAVEDGARWTAGWRPADRRRPRGPWVSRFKEQPQLIAALPGEATLSYLTATMVKDQVIEMLGPIRADNVKVELGAVAMRPWKGRIANHYELAYQSLNECHGLAA